MKPPLTSPDFNPTQHTCNFFEFVCICICVFTGFMYLCAALVFEIKTGLSVGWYPQGFALNSKLPHALLGIITVIIIISFNLVIPFCVSSLSLLWTFTCPPMHHHLPHALRSIIIVGVVNSNLQYHTLSSLVLPGGSDPCQYLSVDLTFKIGSNQFWQCKDPKSAWYCTTSIIQVTIWSINCNNIIFSTLTKTSIINFYLPLTKHQKYRKQIDNKPQEDQWPHHCINASHRSYWVTQMTEKCYDKDNYLKDRDENNDPED